MAECTTKSLFFAGLGRKKIQGDVCQNPAEIRAKNARRFEDPDRMVCKQLQQNGL